MKKPNFLRTLPLAVAAAFLIPGAASVPAKPVQVWVNSQGEADYYKDMVALYNEKTGADLEAEFRAYGFTEMPDKLALAIKSGINVPDIVQLDEIFFSIYLRDEVPFVDLTERIAASPLATGILPQRMGPFTWKGRTYAVPQSISNVVLWYREDLFREHGIAPSSLRTWEGFEEVAERVRTPNRHMLALDWSYLGILLRQRGSDFYGPEGEPLQDSAMIVDTWNQLRRWNEEGVGFMPGQGGIFSPQFFATSVAASGVFTIMGADWYGLDILQNFDPDRKGRWKAMQLPVWTDSKSRGGHNTSTFSGQGLMIFKKSPRVEESWDFIEWVMTDVDANVARYLDGNAFTPYQPAWSDLRLSRPEPYFGDQTLTSLFMQLAPGAPHTGQSPANALIVNFLREQYFAETMAGTVTPEEAFNEMRDKLRQMGLGE